MTYLMLALIGFTGTVTGEEQEIQNEVEVLSVETDSSNVELGDFLIISPGPVHDILNVSLAYSFGETITLELYDVIGCCVLRTTVQSPRMSIDVSHLERGVYFVSVVMGESERLTRRVIVY